MTGLNLPLALPGLAGEPTASQLANLNNNNFGMQADINGQQNAFQSLLFNAPTIGPDGVGQRGGINLDGISMIGKTLGSMGMLYNAFQQQKLAKDQFKFQRKAYQTNVNNQTQTYNTSLEDRARSRYHQQNGTQAEADQYITDNRL